MHNLLMCVLPDDDWYRVETWRYYVLNFKHKLTLTYCASGCFLCHKKLSNAHTADFVTFARLGFLI